MPFDYIYTLQLEQHPIVTTNNQSLSPRTAPHPVNFTKNTRTAEPTTYACVIITFNHLCSLLFLSVSQHALFPSGYVVTEILFFLNHAPPPPPHYHLPPKQKFSLEPSP